MLQSLRLASSRSRAALHSSCRVAVTLTHAACVPDEEPHPLPLAIMHSCLQHPCILEHSVHDWLREEERSTALPCGMHFLFWFGFVWDRNYNCFLAIWTWEILLSWQSRLKTYCRRPRRLAAVLALADLARQHDRPPLRQWCGARFSSATT